MKKYSHFTLEQWLSHLENRHEQEIQLGLPRVAQVAQTLHLLQPRIPVITVAGTNGKGSTVAALESIYTAAGYQVASYTSPHLLLFNERIRINQQAISDQSLCEAFAIIEEARGEVPLTYFEQTTLAALWHFKQRSLDLLILEVGLGGRLDATNIIAADLAIITTIDFDHQAFLGTTKEAIGFEKAGILRPYKPFIFADINPPASVLAQASTLKSEQYLYGKDYDYQVVDSIFQFRTQETVMHLPSPTLHLKAVAAAVMASQCLKARLPVGVEQLSVGVQHAFLPGRLQLIGGRVTTLLDVSHNVQAVNYLAQFIKDFHPKGVVHAVFSALKDKDLPGLIFPLLDYVDHWHLSVLATKRAAKKKQLYCAFSSFSNQMPLCYNTPSLAYDVARSQANPGDLIVVYGSFFTVADVMNELTGV